MKSVKFRKWNKEKFVEFEVNGDVVGDFKALKLISVDSLFQYCVYDRTTFINRSVIFVWSIVDVCGEEMCICDITPNYNDFPSDKTGQALLMRSKNNPHRVQDVYIPKADLIYGLYVSKILSWYKEDKNQNGKN